MGTRTSCAIDWTTQEGQCHPMPVVATPSLVGVLAKEFGVSQSLLLGSTIVVALEYGISVRGGPAPNPERIGPRPRRARALDG